MTWYDPDSLATWALGPSYTSILFTILVVLLAPVLLHYLLYRPSAPSSLARFVVCGPSGAGKTALVTTFESPESRQTQTHTSIDIRIVKAALPASTRAGSSRFRSEHDPSLKDSAAQKILLVDTPGHSKLRSQALSAIDGTDTLTGVIFVVDAANLSADASASATPDQKSGLAEAAGYLHDVLLALQTKQAKVRASKRKDVQLLVATNKMDLFTALPVALVRRSLEVEIGRERESRARGLLLGGDVEAEARAAATEAEVEREPLAGAAEGAFSFEQMAEWGVEVQVLGGSLGGEEEVRTEEWWDWIASLL